LSLNPPPISVSLALILFAGNRGFEELTSNSKLKVLLSSRAAVKETIDSVDTFLRVISTIGPPGLRGERGPNTDTTSMGC
jgi:hypothetical protein